MIVKLYKIDKYIKLEYLFPDKSKTYRACHAKLSVENQWNKLIKYLGDGWLLIIMELKKNNHLSLEKNWMFSTSIAAIQSSKVFYSLIET